MSYELNKNKTFEVDGWELTVILQGFSSITKEPKTGADIGVIVDLKRYDLQISKAVWVQAKQSGKLPDNSIASLKDLRGQIEDMLVHTEEAYAMVYSVDGVVLFKGKDYQNMFSLDELITETASCVRGDRRPQFIADTVYREHLIELVFEKLDESDSQQQTFNWKNYGF